MPASHEQQRPFEIRLTLPVRTYDIDFAGVVSNLVYIRWLEDLRLKMLEVHLPLEQQMANGYGPVLASTQIEYKYALRLFDQPVGKMWIAKLERIRFTLQAEIYLSQKLVAVATQVCFLVNLANMRPMPIPEKISQEYLAYQCD